ncbi:transposase family protein [Streptomyces sp. NPDC091682]|uniref:transposase family protein n=1 Tax=Streptomyces sp. NPDC091682 TaxID=3366005 RepID=UPI0038147850
MRVDAQCTAGGAACPVCGTRSNRVHGPYLRFPADVPSGGRRVVLQLKVRRRARARGARTRTAYSDPGIGGSAVPSAGYAPGPATAGARRNTWRGSRRSEIGTVSRPLWRASRSCRSRRGGGHRSVRGPQSPIAGQTRRHRRPCIWKRGSRPHVAGISPDDAA